MGRTKGQRHKVAHDPTYGFRYYTNPPPLDLHALPPNVGITIPPDGGFWLVDRDTGVRFRRITMDDLPKSTTWNTRGPAATEDDE